MLMKNIITTAFAFAALLAVSTVKADDSNQQGDNNNQGENCGGWSEDFEQVIVLSATTNAPNGAAGTACLRAEDDEDGTAAFLKVRVTGLNPDSYEVSVTDFTGTNSYDLGAVIVSTNSYLCSSEVEDEMNDDEQTNTVSQGTNAVSLGRATFALPTGLDPTNVAYLFIYDTNNVVQF